MRCYFPGSRRLSAPLALVAMLLVSPVLAQESVYRWTDADGVTHYTQTPPPTGVTYEKTVSKAPKASEEAARAEAEKKAAETAGAAAANDSRKAACEAARQNVTVLAGTLPVRMARPKADGTTSGDDPGELLNDADRAKELRRAQLEVEINCD